MPRPNLPVDSARAPRVAGLVCFLQSLLLLLAGGSYLMDLVRGTATEPGIAGMAMTVCLVFAALLALLGGAWFSGRRWPRSPTIVWNLLLLPAAWTLAGTEGVLVGLGTAVVAIVAIGAAVSAPAPDLSDTAL